MQICNKMQQACVIKLISITPHATRPDSAASACAAHPAAPFPLQHPTRRASLQAPSNAILSPPFAVASASPVFAAGAATAHGTAMSPSSADPSAPWVSLGTPAEELRLEFTLLTGQSFRWVQTGEGRYTGVIGQRVVEMRQHDSDVSYRVLARGPAAPPEGDAAAIADYFNLGTSLAALRAQWSKADDRFAAVTPYLPGAPAARLRASDDVMELQKPFECVLWSWKLAGSGPRLTLCAFSREVG